MLEEFNDEIDVLCSIYSENVIIERGSGNGEHKIIYRDPDAAYIAIFQIPCNYPHAQPIVDIDFISRIGEVRKTFLLSEIQCLIASMEGEVVIFAAIEKLKELVAGKLMEEDETEHVFGVNTEVLVQYSHHKEEEQISSVTVIHGPISIEQKSSFQSHFAVVRSMQEVEEFKQGVLSDKKIARATHNIFAYRFTCPNGTGVVYHDCDDDGETAAAGRVAEMIRLMGVDGIAIIVSRWFGGILLGPDRFKFICNSARNLLEDHGYGKSRKK